MEKSISWLPRSPKRQKSAYDHGRFISSLIEHPNQAFPRNREVTLEARTRITDITKIKTELQASEYLKKMTALLHPQGA